jgi:HD-GYP domain-containing protein (c-di-GMP phosphodiesterase class II)
MRNTLELATLLETAMAQVYAEPAQALVLLEQVIALSRKQHDSQRLALALLNAGFAANTSSDHMRALEYLTEANGLFESLADTEHAAACRINIGLVYERCGDFEGALEQFEQALDRSVGHLRSRGMAVLYIAKVAAKLGDFEKALQYGLETLDTAQLLGEEIGIGWAHHLLGTVLYERGDESERILQHLQAALEIAQRQQVQDLHGKTQVALAPVFAALGRADEAWNASTTALQIALITGDRRLETESLIERAALHADVTAASADLDQALQLARSLSGYDLIARVHLERSKLAERQNDYRTAFEAHQSFHQAEAEFKSHAAERRASLVNARLGLERAHMESDLHRLKSVELEALVQERTAQLEANQIETLDLLATIGEFRDHETSNHTSRVGDWSAKLAARLGCDPTQVRLIAQAAKLHDIGKIAVSDTILLKPGKLTAEEYDEMKTHTTRGARMLEQGTSDVLCCARRIALSHHERWDGRGYPHGIVGESIPLEARIVSVVDVFDALTSDRPYKQAWTVEAALAELEANAGGQFDPAVVQAFLTVIAKERGQIKL